MSNKKIVILLVLAAFAGGFLGSLVSAGKVQANAFSDFYNNLIKPLFPQNQSGQNQLWHSQEQNKIQQAPAAKYESNVEYENAVMDVVDRVSPAVVSIVISKNVPVAEQCPYNPFSNLPEEFQQFFGDQGGIQFYQSCNSKTKTQLQEVGEGSGFIISKDGLVLTNKHVVYDKSAIYTVYTNDGKKYNAKVLAQSPVVDLAVVKIDATNLPTVILGDSAGIRLGQTAIAIGNALGEFRNTVSIGVVSGLARTITASGGDVGSEVIDGVIQTSAAINPGNSGGPLLNLKGEVIGINVATVSGAQNIGFAIPINQAKKAIDSVKKSGKISTPYLGIRNITITPDYAVKNNLPVNYGALVQGDKNNSAVMSGSPADKAGIKKGDIITEVNGDKINQNNSLTSLIQKYNVGDTITLNILRDGKEIEIKVVLEERPINQ